MNEETKLTPMQTPTSPSFAPDGSPHVATTVPPPLPKPLSYWLKKLLVCNPFYLASAALLLFGVCRISLDGNFFPTETRQLFFNFSALQVYELLLAATAALLVSRRVWYDASLLVGLENLLWIVPFILLSQAAFLASGTATVLCLLAVALTASRAVWLRNRADAIMPAGRALWCGLPILLVNAGWPILYRHFQETKMGVNITSGAAYACNEFNWFWLLPALGLLLIVLPRPATEAAGSPMRRWFPLLLFAFWLLGTGVHLYALGYVYDFKLRREQLAPVLWMLAWVLPVRWPDFFATRAGSRSGPTLLLPLLATFPAALVAESRVCFILSAVNFCAYAIRLLLAADNRLVVQLALISFVAMVVSIPIDFAPLVARPFPQTQIIGMAAFAYVIVGAMLSRHPKVAILGAFATMVVVGVVRQAHADWVNWAGQAGLVYFLLHSLRWQDAEHHGAAGVRMVVAGSWILHTYVWVSNGAPLLPTLGLAGAVLAIWTLRGLLWKNWRLLTLPSAAGLVMLCGPTRLLLVQTHAAPSGMLYVVGSFALFALGTLAALTKHRWHKAHSVTAPDPASGPCEPNPS